MNTELFDYDLPEERIAQRPLPEREQSRLLHWNRQTRARVHTHFSRIDSLLNPGDVLVFNDTRVIPARLHGVKTGTAGRVEFLLLEADASRPNAWWSMLKPGKRLHPGSTVTLLDRSGNPTAHTVTLLAKNEEGHGLLQFSGGADVLSELELLGEMPLPPYIRPDPARAAEDITRYQTVFASTPGSVAAPTAGLHFSETVLTRLKARGVELQFVTLQVGLGTFAPVKTGNLEDHKMHVERYSVTSETARAVNRARDEGRRIIAVGTTSMRVLESVASANEGRLIAGRGETGIFIYPPHDFRLVDGLVTNFHLPRSTLLMLVSAFAAPGSTAGIPLIKELYQEAIREEYRFFSYGDGMLIL